VVGSSTAPGEKSVFLVHNPGHGIENVVVIAKDREEAKGRARYILKADPDKYVVDVITNQASKTLFYLGTF
jgi:hypothetical protein